MATINIVKPGGGIGAIDDSQLADAVDQGVATRVATPAEVAAYDARQKYGGIGQQAIASAEGLARGVTLGLSTAAEKALGVDPEAIKGRQVAHPITSTVSELAGNIAPLLIPGVGELAPAAIAARGGKLASVGAEAALGASKLAKVAGAAIGAGVEGAAYGTGQAVDEYVLGEDPELSAEKFLTAIGTNALLGGAVGGVAKLAGMGLSSGIGKVGGMLKGPKLQQLSDESAFYALGEGQMQLRQVEKAKKAFGPDYRSEIGKQVKAEGILQSVTDGAEDLLPRIQSRKAEEGKRIGTMLNQMDQAELSIHPDKAELAEKLRLGVMIPLQQSEMVADRKLAKALEEDYLQHYLAKGEQIQGQAADTVKFTKLHELRRKLDERINFDKTGTDPLTAQLRKARGVVEGYLNEKADEAATRLGSDFADQYRDAKKKYRLFASIEPITAKRELINETNQSLGGSPLAAGAVGALLTGNPMGALYGLGASAVQTYAAGLTKKYGRSAIALGLDDIGSKIGKVDELISRGVDSLFSPKLTVPVTSQVSKSLQDRFEEKQKQYTGINPAQIQDLVDQRLAAMGITPSEAPQLRQALVARTGSGVAYIQGKQPGSKGIAPDNLFAHLDKGPKVSASDQKKWLDVVAAIEDPKTVLNAISSGTVSDGQMAALREVYPKLNEQVLKASMDRSSKVRSMPSQKALRTLSKLTGKAVSSTNSAKFLLAAQQTHRQTARKESGPVSSSKINSQQLSSSQRLEA